MGVTRECFVNKNAHQATQACSTGLKWRTGIQTAFLYDRILPEFKRSYPPTHTHTYTHARARERTHAYIHIH